MDMFDFNSRAAKIDSESIKLI